MDAPYSLLDGLDTDSDEYREIQKELSDYESNLEMWGNQLEIINDEYKELCSATSIQIKRIYNYALSGYSTEYRNKNG